MSATPSPGSATGDGEISPLARRFGPPLAIGSLVLTAVVLGWLAVAPTAIVGPLSDAPFAVPATIVVGPDDEGCLDVVRGDATSRTHCLDELAPTREGWTNVWFDDGGQVVVSREDQDGQVLLTLDPVSGDVVDRDERSWEEDPRGPIGQPDREHRIEVYPDGDRVLRAEVGGPGPRQDPDEAEVVLDVDGPPGYRLRDAVLSPDGSWVVVVTPDDRVAVAPADGTAAPYVWTEVPGDTWVDLHAAIRWED